MIVVLGASGYIGEAFVRELKNRGEAFLAISRSQLDYTRFEELLGFLREKKPAFLINAAGYTGRPNVDACEIAKADTLARSCRRRLPMRAPSQGFPGATFLRAAFIPAQKLWKAEKCVSRRT
jgi:NAD(P)-dependent dehydrogenase (short-subunit alcohol dehydrogenase family)